MIDFGTQHVTFTVGPDGKPTGFDTQTLGPFKRVEASKGRYADSSRSGFSI